MVAVVTLCCGPSPGPRAGEARTQHPAVPVQRGEGDPEAERGAAQREYRGDQLLLAQEVFRYISTSGEGGGLPGQLAFLCLLLLQFCSLWSVHSVLLSADCSVLLHAVHLVPLCPAQVILVSFVQIQFTVFCLIPF